MITHHLSDEFLVEYANGSLPGPEALVVGSHLAICAECRDRVETFETVSAVLLEEGEVEAVSPGALEAILAKIDGPEEEDSAPLIEFDRDTLEIIPPPLRTYLDGSLSDLDWKRTGRGIEEASLVRDEDVRISLLRIRAGQKVPSHTHRGEEFTLVLSGGYADGDDHFGKGDVSLADSAKDHAPVADSNGPCLCLTVRNGATRLTGPIGRFLNPVMRG
ncbi:MAG: anti-sigma factor [Rhodospirillaceae bacterium]|jgi:putative transcriptional regulator|nr:anti-sigma factor [Rhodospirillaceae bacterium]MBT6283985.1 anti-sigma factor [Rhodospirillaceae bacterium]